METIRRIKFKNHEFELLNSVQVSDEEIKMLEEFNQQDAMLYILLKMFELRKTEEGL